MYREREREKERERERERERGRGRGRGRGSPSKSQSPLGARKKKRSAFGALPKVPCSANRGMPYSSKFICTGPDPGQGK